MFRRPIVHHCNCDSDTHLFGFLIFLFTGIIAIIVSAVVSIFESKKVKQKESQ